MKTKKMLIKDELYDLFVNGFIKYEDLIMCWNSVRFLSKKSTDVWFNALKHPEVKFPSKKSISYALKHPEVKFLSKKSASIWSCAL